MYTYVRFASVVDTKRDLGGEQSAGLGRKATFPGGLRVPGRGRGGAQCGGSARVHLWALRTRFLGAFFAWGLRNRFITHITKRIDSIAGHTFCTPLPHVAPSYRYGQGWCGQECPHMPVHAGRVPPGRKCTAMAPHPTLVTPSFPFGRSSRARRAPIGDVDVCPSRAYIPLSYHALSLHPLPDVRTYLRGRNLQPVAPTPPRTLALHRRYSSHSSPSHAHPLPHTNQTPV